MILYPLKTMLRRLSLPGVPVDEILNDLKSLWIKYVIEDEQASMTDDEMRAFIKKSMREAIKGGVSPKTLSDEDVQRILKNAEATAAEPIKELSSV